MSTAALASARRRRTTNDPAVASQNIATKTSPQESPNAAKQPPPSPQSLTPLQILQIHDNKLKDLEALMIELNSEEFITSIVEEKIKALVPNTNTNTNTNTNVGTNALELKIQALETTIQNNSNIQNVIFDEFKKGIQENFNTFKETTIKMIDLLNVKEHQSFTSETNIDTDKLNMVSNEVNDLKLLVIKNQTLALETCTSIINMKDQFKINNEKIEEIIEKISIMNSAQCNNEQCNSAQCDPAQMFLQSFMKNKLFGGSGSINIDANYDDGEEYEDDDIMNGNNNKKLHIDLTNDQIVLDDGEIISDDDKITFGAGELIIDENQLEDILELNKMPEVKLDHVSQTGNLDLESAI
jgi:hypothetical protein